MGVDVLLQAARGYAEEVVDLQQQGVGLGDEGLVADDQGVLQVRAIRLESLVARQPVLDLVNKIEAFIDAYNASATPFVWVATAQSIIDKVARIEMRISGTAR